MKEQKHYSLISNQKSNEQFLPCLSRFIQELQCCLREISVPFSAGGKLNTPYRGSSRGSSVVQHSLGLATVHANLSTSVDDIYLRKTGVRKSFVDIFLAGDHISEAVW